MPAQGSFFPRLTVHRQRRQMSAQALQLPTLPRLSIPGANLQRICRLGSLPHLYG